MGKRLIAWLLFVVMTVSLLPFPAFALEEQTGSAETELTEPEMTEPEMTEAEVMEPEMTQPEMTEAEVMEPEVTEPEMTEAEVMEPEVTEPEVTEPEATEPESAEELPRLAMPRELTWHTDYVYDEVLGMTVPKYRPGAISWTPASPDHGEAEIVVYRNGQVYDTYYDSYDPEEAFGSRSMTRFLLSDPESGSYYFTVRSLPYWDGWQASDIAVSDTWEYTKPDTVPAACYGPCWSWRFAQWNCPEGENALCQVQFYFAPTLEQEPEYAGTMWDVTSYGGADAWQGLLDDWGDGYYYFRVRTLSEDLNERCHGAWSELSLPEYLCADPEAPVDQGDYGDIHWKITRDYVLVISGQGEIPESMDGAPWHRADVQVAGIVVEEGITSIGSGAFMLLAAETVSLPDTLTTIGELAFYQCKSLRTLHLPASVTELGTGFVGGCVKLVSITVDGGNPTFFSEDGILFGGLVGMDGRVLIAYPGGKTARRYTLPQNVYGIFHGAFLENGVLEEVSLPKNLLLIGEDAFWGCMLKTLTLPQNVQTIGSGAFEGCFELEQITFRGDPPVIGEDAFFCVEADVYYPSGNPGWTEEVRQSYGGKLNWMPDNYLEITGENSLVAGQETRLTAAIRPHGGWGEAIVWSLAEGDEDYVVLEPSGSTALVIARDVTEVHEITVIARSGADIAPAQFTMTLCPRVQQVKLYETWVTPEGEPGFNDLATGEWWYLTLNDDNRYGFTLQLEGQFLPEGSRDDYVWSSSNPRVATIDGSGLAHFTGKPGSTTFTLTTAGGVEASVTYKIVDPILSAEAVGDTHLELISGQSVTLKIRNAQTGKAITGKNVQWSLWLPGGDAASCATISTSGKLTAKKVQAKTTLYAVADVLTDGVYTDFVEYEITLYPAATHVEIYRDGETVTGQTLYFDLNTMDILYLDAAALPGDTMPRKVDWITADSKNRYARYSYVEDNLVAIHSPTGKEGTVKLTVKAADGSKKSAVVTLRFGRFAQSVQIWELPETLTSGKSLTLKAGITPGNVSKGGVTWSLADPADKAYVTLSGSKLTAKNVYRPQEVTLIATSKDGRAWDSCTVTIMPKDPEGIAIRNPRTGEILTGGTVYVDLNSTAREVLLEAVTLSDGEWVYADWSSKGKSGEIRNSPSGLWVCMNKAGSVTVTAKAGGRTASVTVKAAKMAKSLEITTKNGKNLTFDGEGRPMVWVASGKSVDLKALVTGGSGSKVTWSVVQGADAVSVSASGKVTAAKNLTRGADAVIRATAADGSGKYAEMKISVTPLATGIAVYTLEEDLNRRTLNLRSGGWLSNRSNTTVLWDMAAVDEGGQPNDSFRVYSLVYPYDESQPGRNAAQQVTWKSSSTAVAAVSADGTVTCRKAGTTTITCTAADGSGQKISFKLTVVKRVQEIRLPDAEVAGGKSISLKPVFEPGDATNKKVFWDMAGDTAFATLTQKGKLTAKKVTAPKTVWVYAYAQDGSEVYGVCRVTIYPQGASSVELTMEGRPLTGQTLTLAVGETLTLTPVVNPEGKASRQVTWKSSDASAVSVEEGVITVRKPGKTVTITCTAADGSGKKATVQIKTVR